MSFLTYLDDYEKKFEKKAFIEQPKQVVAQKVIKENVVKPKKVIKIIKKSIVTNVKSTNENINRAANILDGIEDYGGNPMMPSSSRYYDNTSFSSKQNINIESKSITSKANDLLSDDNSVGMGGLPQPLMNIPQMDIEMLKHVPTEMLTEEQKVQVQVQRSNFQPNVEKSEKQDNQVPSEIQQMMEHTKQMQNMFNQNIDTSDIPQELREYVNL